MGNGMMRYRRALAMGRDAYRQALDEDAELLGSFGLRLLVVDTTLTVAVEDELDGKHIHPWNTFEINGRVWGWLRPLLVRLRELDEPCNVLDMVAAK